jgi:hypothetical protein
VIYRAGSASLAGAQAPTASLCTPIMLASHIPQSFRCGHQSAFSIREKNYHTFG